MKCKHLEMVLLSLLLVGIGFMVLTIMQRNTMQAFKQQAVEQECAHYNSIDGEFEWLRKDK